MGGGRRAPASAAPPAQQGRCLSAGVYARAGPPQPVRCQCSAAHRDQLHLEIQRGVGRNHTTRATLAIGNARWAGQLGLAAGLHALHAFGPAGDHAVQRKLGGLATLVRAVELLAIEQGTFVMDLDGIGGLGRLARAFLDRFKHQAAGGGDRLGLRQSGGGNDQRSEQGEKNAHEESSKKTKADGRALGVRSGMQAMRVGALPAFRGGRPVLLRGAVLSK